MENASKALIMAASVLIGIVIASMAVYLFTSFSGSINEMQGQMEEGQLQKFNSQFTSYVGKENLTIYDVITVANLAIDNNNYYDLNEKSENNFYITVKLKNNTELQKLTKQQLENNYLANIDSQMTEIEDVITGEPIKKLTNYTCTVELNPNTGRVKLVKFSEKISWKNT